MSIMYNGAQHTVMSLPATAIMVLHHTLSLSATTIMMLYCTLSDRCYHHHGAPLYAIRHALPLSGCSTVNYWYLRPLYQSAVIENHRIFPSFFRTQWWRPLMFRSTPSCLFSMRIYLNTHN